MKSREKTRQENRRYRQSGFRAEGSRTRRKKKKAKQKIFLFELKIFI